MSTPCHRVAIPGFVISFMSKACVGGLASISILPPRHSEVQRLGKCARGTQGAQESEQAPRGTPRPQGVHLSSHRWALTCQGVARSSGPVHGYAPWPGLSRPTPKPGPWGWGRSSPLLRRLTMLGCDCPVRGPDPGGMSRSCPRFNSFVSQQCHPMHTANLYRRWKSIGQVFSAQRSGPQDHPSSKPGRGFR